MSWSADTLAKQISDLVTPMLNVPTVKVDDPFGKAVAKLAQDPSGAVLVVDDSGKLFGLVTAKDLAKLDIAPPPQTAKDLATTSKVVAIRDHANFGQLLRIMNGDNVRRQSLDRIPVVDDSNHPVGLIQRDRLRQKLSYFKPKSRMSPGPSY